MRTMKIRDFSGTLSDVIEEREITNRQLSRKAAVEGMVLLKNEGNLLPLEKGSKVALYGIGASKTIKGGTGSGDVNERDKVSIFQGMKNAGYVITNEDWIQDFDKKYDEARNAWRDQILERERNEDAFLGFFEYYSTTPFVMPAGGPIEKTDADVAFYILSRVAGEGADRYDKEGDYYLTETEKKQLSDICSLYKHVVVAVNTGGLADLSFMDEFSNIEALLQIVQPGMEGGNAFADILSGAATPSGKLTDSWAYKYEDYPNSESFSHNNGNVDAEYYKEGLYVGYRYFDSFDVPVRYGFGYGLSYTDFETKVTGVSCADEKVVIETETANVGNTYSGKEVIQIYVTCPAGKLEKEYRRLVAFGKTEILAPGEKESQKFEIALDRLTSYSEEKAGWVLEAGDYVFWEGNSLADSVPCGVLKLDEEVILTKTDNICPLKEDLDELKQVPEKMQEKYKKLYADAEEKNLPGIVLADGPAGLRLLKHYVVQDGKILPTDFKNSVEGGFFCENDPKKPGDVYNQYCTAIPVGTLLAQSWNEKLIEELGEMIGGEMEEFHVTLWLAPGMNIHRNPLCGRNFEYYSEDPFLSGKMAAAMTKGVQKVPGCGTTIKHYACNNQEDNRMGSNSILSERTLREIYLKGFEIAIKESQPMSIMTSYNLINGVHAANCNDTCTKAARCEWGFKGMIMTDWTTTEHGPDCTASGCMRAGNDLVMPGAASDRENIKKELDEGTLSLDDLKACISRTVDIIWQSNQYEGAVPYKK